MSSATSVPVLSTSLGDSTLRLRAHEPTDLPRIVEFANDPRSQRWVPLPTPYGRQQAEEFIAQTRQNWEGDPVHPTWAIDLDGTFAGGVNLHPRGPGVWELGYSAHPGVRGRGVVTAAARLAIDYGFEHLGARTITWRAARGNFGSRRVAWALGFTTGATWEAMHHDTHGEHVDDLWVGHLHREDPRAPQVPWLEPVELTDGVIALRAWRPEHAPTDGPDEGARFVQDIQPTPDTYADWLLDRQDRMAGGDAVFWRIADAATDETLGHIQVTGLRIQFIKGSGSVGYWLVPHARGKGHVQRALDLLIPHAFAERTDDGGRTGLGLHRLQAGTDARNRASRRTLLRAGFKLWGSEREVLTYGGTAAQDADSYELLATDDRAAQAIVAPKHPIITTDNLVLRPWRDDDRPDQAPEPSATGSSNRFGDPEYFAAWQLKSGRAYDTRQAIDWCIADRESDRALGNITLFDLHKRTPNDAELGYWLFEQERGRGVATEAASAVVEAARETLGMTRLHAETDLDNIASQRVLLKVGFKQWGTDHQAFTNSAGEVVDGAYFELLDLDSADRPQLPALIPGDVVTLRPLAPADVPRVQEAWQDPLTQLWLDISPRAVEEADRNIRGRRYVDRGGHGWWWTICGPEDDTFLGAVGLQNFTDGPPRRVEVGYWLHPDARGRGIATAAVKLAVDHAFGPHGPRAERVILNVAEGNDASVRVAQKAGFTQVGRDRKAEPLGDGSIVDLLRFDRLADD